MEEALSFFRAFEIWIYIIIGLGALIYVRKFVISWQELKEATFGLERQSAQSRLNQSAIMLVILIGMLVVEFSLVYFVAPGSPGANPLPTTTLDLLATPTTTLPEEAANPGTEELPAEETLQPTSKPGCIPNQIEITFPTDGQEINGVVEIRGSADILNFGFYKIQIKRPDEALWLTLQAGNSVVQDEKLADLDTTQLIPGQYELGLVVVDNEAHSSPPCSVFVRVVNTPEE
jgi:hypothetical protein